MADDVVQFSLGGMNEALVPEQGVAQAIYNLRRDPEGYWRELPGTIPVTNAAPASGPVTSATWFSPRPNLRFLVYEVATASNRSTIQYVDFQTTSPVAIATRRRLSSQDRGTLFLENAGWLYLFSSTDAPLAWNGYWTRPVGFVTPAPSLVISGHDQGYQEPDRAGGNMVGPVLKDRSAQRGVGEFPTSAPAYWRYGYALTMISESGQESPPSELAFASGFNDNSNTIGRRMVKLKIPSLPEHIQGVRIWRTRNLIQDVNPANVTSQSDLYLLAEFSAPGGFDYLDLSSDQELDILLDQALLGPVPLGVTTAAFWGSSLWLGGSPSAPSRVYYSHELFPEQFPSVNYLDVGSSQTGRVVALRVTQRGLIVFKERGVFMIHGSPTDGYRVDSISEIIGCVSPRAIEYVQGLGLAFLSPKGPYVLQGELADEQPTQLMPLPGIRRTWRRHVGLTSSLAQAVSYYDTEHNELWFHLPVGNNLAPTLGIVYHLDLGQWSLRTGSVSCFAASRGRLFLGSWDDTLAPGMHLLTHGATTFLGAATSSSYQVTLQFDEFKVVRDVELWAVATGSSAPVQLKTQGDQEAVRPQTTVGKAQVLNASTREVWGTGVWQVAGGTATWADQMLARLRMSAHIAAGRELSLTVSATRARWVALKLVAAPGITPRPETP